MARKRKLVVRPDGKWVRPAPLTARARARPRKEATRKRPEEQTVNYWLEKWKSLSLPEERKVLLDRAAMFMVMLKSRFESMEADDFPADKLKSYLELDEACMKALVDAGVFPAKQQESVPPSGARMPTTPDDASEFQ